MEVKLFRLLIWTTLSVKSYEKTKQNKSFNSDFIYSIYLDAKHSFLLTTQISHSKCAQEITQLIRIRIKWEHQFLLPCKPIDMMLNWKKSTLIVQKRKTNHTVKNKGWYYLLFPQMSQNKWINRFIPTFWPAAKYRIV